MPLFSMYGRPEAIDFIVDEEQYTHEQCVLIWSFNITQGSSFILWWHIGFLHLLFFYFYFVISMNKLRELKGQKWHTVFFSMKRLMAHADVIRDKVSRIYCEIHLNMHLLAVLSSIGTEYGLFDRLIFPSNRRCYKIGKFLKFLV